MSAGKLRRDRGTQERVPCEQQWRRFWEKAPRPGAGRLEREAQAALPAKLWPGKATPPVSPLGP